MIVWGLMSDSKTSTYTLSEQGATGESGPESDMLISLEYSALSC